MRFNIYSDESAITGSRYMLIGGLWVPQPVEPDVRKYIGETRSRFRLGAEMKWTKISEKMLPAYCDFADALFAHRDASFKCIVVDTHILDYGAFSRGDGELGFYKFYFQLISRKLSADNLYWLYTDARLNRKKSRLATLRIITNRWCQKNIGVQPLRAVEPRPSDGEDLIQLADVLLGAVSSAWNASATRPAKNALIAHIAKRLGRTSLAAQTGVGEPKFNVWKWQPTRKTNDAP